MPALQEIGNFLQELVSKPTGFWNKLNNIMILDFMPPDSLPGHCA
jgi:hypothetical protein